VFAMLVLTAGEILYKTTATAHVLDAAPDGLTGQYQGLYTGAATSGTMLAPALGGLLYGVAPHLLWPVCGVVAGVAAVTALITGSHRRTDEFRAAARSEPATPQPRTQGAPP
jgi:MFS family permease